jgi:GH15 family glucan-1,4-alpha-glucosidase
MAVHKYNMGVVGNCTYLAYIDTMADVKWMCLPRFDSSFLFGSLLDEQRAVISAFARPTKTVIPVNIISLIPMCSVRNLPAGTGSLS